MRRKHLIILAVLILVCILGGYLFSNNLSRDKRGALEEGEQEFEREAQKLQTEQDKEVREKRGTPTEKGAAITYTDDFDSTTLGMTLEEIKKLPVYYMDVPSDDMAYYQELAKGLFGEAFDRADTTTNGANGVEKEFGRDFSTIFEGEPSLKLEGNLFVMNFEQSGIVKDEKPDADILQETQALIQRLKLGIWDGDTCLMSLQKKSVSEVTAYMEFEGLPCTSHSYGPGSDGVQYISGSGTNGGIRFIWREGVLRKVNDMRTATVASREAISCEYSSIDELLEKSEEAFVKTESAALSDEDAGGYCIYEISDIHIVYVFGYQENAASRKEVFVAVPMLELSGTMDMYWFAQGTWGHYEKESLGINLKTGEMLVAEY